MAQFKRTNRVGRDFRIKSGGQARFRATGGRKKPPCKICSLPEEDRLAYDWLLLSGYARNIADKEHLQHLADEIQTSSKYRDGSYGDALLGKIEWAMQQMEEIAGEQREKEKPKLAILALKHLADLAATQAKILGLGVPRGGNKSLHLHLNQDVKPDDLNRAISAFQRTQLPAPASATVVEVESVPEVERPAD